MNQPTPDRAEVVEAAITALLVDGSSIYWGGKAYRITEIKKSTALAVTDIRTVLKNIVLASNFTKQANQKVDELVQLFIEATNRVIGEDRDMDEFSIYENRLQIINENDLKAEQRQRLAELVGKKSWEGADSVEIFHDPRFDDEADNFNPKKEN